MFTQGLCSPTVLGLFGNQSSSHPPLPIFGIRSAAATVNSRACVAHGHRQTLRGQENLPYLPLPQLHPLSVAPALFSSLQVLLRTEGEDKEKGVEPKSLPKAASPPPRWHLTASTPTRASTAAPASTGEVNNNSQLGQLDNLTIFTTATHTHQSLQICLKHLLLCIPLFPLAAHHFGAMLCPPLPLASEEACSPSQRAGWNRSLGCPDHHRGFLACLQGCAGSHCWGLSGMPIETEEAWKEVGRLCLHKQWITIFGLLILWL